MLRACLFVVWRAIFMQITYICCHTLAFQIQPSLSILSTASFTHGGCFFLHPFFHKVDVGVFFLLFIRSVCLTSLHRLSNQITRTCNRIFYTFSSFTCRVYLIIRHLHTVNRTLSTDM